MTRDELSEGWERLRGIYSSMPSFSPEIAREWLRVLEPFSRADLDAAISDYISHERYKPLPVDLARLCRKAQRVRREKEFELEFQANGTCPYCGGLGYVRHCLEPDEPDKYFYCKCVHSPDREKGEKILSQALADEAWIFDPKIHGFRRRRGWIGSIPEDNTPVPLAEQAEFWANAADVGRWI